MTKMPKQKIWIHDDRHRTVNHTPIYGEKAIIHLKKKDTTNNTVEKD